jgi:hypothetical protein
MLSSYRRWQKLFLFCLGIAVASTFIMEWLATDFWIDDKKFSILDLELFDSKVAIVNTLTAIKPAVKIALNYQLIFDFVFMAGIYPAIAALCMMVREKINAVPAKSVLFALAMLQPVAWAFDVTENYFLLKWMDAPQIGDEFSTYRNVVIAKWLIALTGVIAALVVLLFRKEKKVVSPKSKT